MKYKLTVEVEVCSEEKAIELINTSGNGCGTTVAHLVI